MSDLERQAIRHAQDEIDQLKAEIERLRGLLADKHYIRIKADYINGHLSHYGWLQAREQALTGEGR